MQKKDLSQMTYQQLKSEAISLGLIKYMGVTKEGFKLFIQEKYNASDPEPVAVKTETKIVNVSKEIEEVMNATAIKTAPVLSERSIAKIENSKSNQVGNILEEKKFNEKVNPYKKLSPDEMQKLQPAIEKIMSAGCSNHIKIYKVFQLGICTKQIAEKTGFGTSMIWSVLKDFSYNQKKREFSDSILV